MIQIGGVTLGNACRARDKCRQAAANGLVNAQTIAIIMSRANQRIGGGENVADLPHETQNMDTASQLSFLDLLLPVTHFGPLARRDEIDIPGGVSTELLPGCKEHIESLVAVLSHGADKRHDLPGSRQAKPQTSSGLLRGRKGTEYRGIAAKVNDLSALGGYAQCID